MAHLQLVIDEYDPAIEFFTNVAGFDLVEARADAHQRAGNRWDLLGPT